MGQSNKHTVSESFVVLCKLVVYNVTTFIHLLFVFYYPYYLPEVVSGGMLSGGDCKYVQNAIIIMIKLI